LQLLKDLVSSRRKLTANFVLAIIPISG